MSISVSKFIPPMPNCNDLYGKRNLKRVDIGICITGSLCSIAETNTTF